MRALFRPQTEESPDDCGILMFAKNPRSLTTVCLLVGVTDGRQLRRSNAVRMPEIWKGLAKKPVLWFCFGLCCSSSGLCLFCSVYCCPSPKRTPRFATSPLRSDRLSQIARLVNIRACTCAWRSLISGNDRSRMVRTPRRKLIFGGPITGEIHLARKATGEISARRRPAP